MGYDIRITRAADWDANAGSEIAAEEWLAIVEADPDLAPDPENGPFSVSYGESRWLDWFEGNVFTTDPDQTTVGKMLDIAGRLSAFVQGDDGERYETADQWGDRSAS